MAIENLAPLAYGIATMVFIFGTASIFLRLYTRAVILKTMGWDDVFALILLVANTFEQAVLYMFLKYGAGLHIERVSAQNLLLLAKWLFIEEVFYVFMHWIIKQAFLLFYLRLSPRKGFQRLVWATMVLNTLVLLVNWLLTFLQCIPFSAIFHRELYPDAKCLNTLVLLILPSVLNIITDVIILVLPIRTIWKLQMSKQRKIGVIAVLGFGFSSVLVSALRIIVLYELHASRDTPYILGKTIIVAALEINLAVIAVNLPSMKALWKKIAGGSSSGSGEGPYSDSKSRGFQLSSFEPGSRNNTQRGGNKTTVSRMDRPMNGSDSEEELFRQAGMGGQIKVTTNLVVSSEEKALDGERESIKTL